MAMEYIDAFLIMTILKSVFSYFFLYKIMELKIHNKTKAQTSCFLVFLIFIFIGNLAFFAFVSWEDEFGTVRYCPDIVEDIIMMLIIMALFHSNIWKKIYYIVFGYVLVMFVDLLKSLFDNIFLQYIVHHISTSNQVAIMFLLEILILSIIYILLRKRNKTQYTIDDKDWPLFAVLAIIVCAYFYYIKNVVPYIDP